MSWLWFQNKRKQKNKPNIEVAEINHRICKKLHGNKSVPRNNTYIPPHNLTKINQLDLAQLGQNERLLQSNDRKTVQNTNVNYITQTSQYILPHTSNAKELIQRLLIQPNSILHPNHSQHNTQNHGFDGVTIHDYKRNSSSIGPVHTDNYFNKNRGKWNMTVSKNIKLFIVPNTRN